MDAITTIYEAAAEMGCPILRQEPMDRHTTMRVGGPAQLFASPADEETIRVLLTRCRELKLPCHVLGNGSNLLVSDSGVEGLVICLGPGFSAVERRGDSLIVQAGASLAQVCAAALREGLTGLEFAWGIPASLGGAVFMNAGAYGGEMKDVVRRVRCVTPEGDFREFGPEELDYRYRHSAFMENGCVIVSAELALAPGDPAEIKAKMDDFLSRRKAKQPLEYPSSGSTFKRPEGAYAAALIDQCGLKGLRVGGAMVSEKHAGFVINYDHATCADILALVEKVRQRVRQETGYLLECEVYRL